MTKLYGNWSNLPSLEPHYCAHVSAMTTEGLHSKSDIAAELAFRDAKIVKLKAHSEHVLSESLWDAEQRAAAALADVAKLRSALQAARTEITNMSVAYGCGFSLAVIDDVDSALAVTEPKP